MLSSVRSSLSFSLPLQPFSLPDQVAVLSSMAGPDVQSKMDKISHCHGQNYLHPLLAFQLKIILVKMVYLGNAKSMRHLTPTSYTTEKG